MSRPAPRSIDEYLKQLREALAGEDPALVQDALYDAEEYLRAEVAQHTGKSEADVLEIIATTYGAPEEVADAYRTTEVQVKAALKPHKPRPRSTAIGRFFSIYAEPRAWTSLFFMLLALFTGIFYFVFTMVGLSLSTSLVFLIVGIPVFIGFVGFTRLLSLVEGRIVEGFLGVRMPRRPRTSDRDLPWLKRIAAMLKDRRTWTTFLYMLVSLPLGVLYFVTAVVGLAVSLTLTFSPVLALLDHFNVIVEHGDMSVGIEPWATPILAVIGILLLTGLLYLAKGVGFAHGNLAKSLLVSQTRD
jgi:uncharacterized membrane protein